MTKTPSSIGPTMVRETQKLAVRQAAKDAWPYWWKYPPRTALPLNLFGTAAVTGGQFIVPFVQTNISTASGPDGGYEVPQGYMAVIWALVFSWNHMALNGGNVYGTLDVGQPLGLVVPSGASVKDLQQVTVPLSGFSDPATPFSFPGPWPLFAPLIFAPRDQIRWKATVSAFQPMGTYVMAGLFGYLVPESEAD